MHDRHLALGAKLADFGGFEMPIEYAGGGVVKEHMAVRDGGRRLRRQPPGQGVGARAGRGRVRERALSNDLGRIGPGQAQYTLCCDEATGGVVDDLIAYLRADDDVLLVPNAANTAEVVRRLAAAAPGRGRGA